MPLLNTVIYYVLCTFLKASYFFSFLYTNMRSKSILQNYIVLIIAASNTITHSLTLEEEEFYTVS